MQQFKPKLYWFAISLLGILSAQVNAQSSREPETDLFDLSLNDLAKVKVTTPSKKSEVLMGSVSSVATINGEDIKKAGCRSIPEALRLLPGVQVREMSPGNYDVHIEGMDNLLPLGQQLTISNNALTLVMIDNRPVYNHFHGGTFWETLPIGIEDIDRIELVKGPNSALYGPNAVAGVINIITKLNNKQESSNGSGTLELAGNGYQRLSIYKDSKINDNWFVGMSGNAYNEQRFTDLYFTDSRGYIPRDSLRFLSGSGRDRYPHPDLSLRKYGGNVFARYESGQNTFLISGGMQDSESQKPYVYNQQSPLSTNRSNSQYLAVDGTLGNQFFTNLSYQRGKQETEGISGWEYEYNVIDAAADYFVDMEGLEIRPGVNFRLAVFNDKKAVELFGTDRAFLGQRRMITTISPHLRLEKSFGGTKFVAAGSVDLFNTPNQKPFNYQFGVLQRLSKSMVIRMSASNSYQGSFVLNSYYEQIFDFGPLQVIQIGNQNLKLLNSREFELGLRFNPGDQLLLELEAHSRYMKDFSLLMNTVNTPSVFQIEYQNIPLLAHQIAATLNAQWQFNPNLYVKGYLTIQETELQHAAATNDNYQDSQLQTNRAHAVSPVVFGGTYGVWRFNKLFSLSSQFYFFGKQKITEEQTTSFTPVTLRDQELYSVKLIAHLSDEAVFSIGARNLFSGDEPQFLGMDPIDKRIILGFSVNF